MDIAAVFEKMTTESGPLLGTGNYKPWARACKTALESLLLFYVIEDDLPEKPTDYFEEVFEESTATIRKDKPDAVYNGQMTAWYADVEDYIAGTHYMASMTALLFISELHHFPNEVSPCVL